LERVAERREHCASVSAPRRFTDRVRGVVEVQRHVGEARCARAHVGAHLRHGVRVIEPPPMPLLWFIICAATGRVAAIATAPLLNPAVNFILPTLWVCPQQRESQRAWRSLSVVLKAVRDSASQD
jgi:hypothetical protein